MSAQKSKETFRGYTQRRSFNNTTFLKILKNNYRYIVVLHVNYTSSVYILLKFIHMHYRHALCLKVVYWEDDTKPETMGKVRVPWNQTSVTVSGLAGNTQYFLTVSAFNTAGTGPFLPAINVTTKKPRKLLHQDNVLFRGLILFYTF